MEIEEGFKQTDLGVIPEDWEVRTLKEINCCDKKTINPSNFKNEIFEYYSIPAYKENTEPIHEKGSKILSQKLLLNENTVLFGRLNPRVEKVWLIETISEKRKIGSTEWIPIHCNETFNAKYIYFLMWSNFVMPIAKQIISGSTPSRQRVKVKDFYDIQIPVPKLVEQKKIAEILSLIDELIQKTKQMIRKTKKLYEGLMQQLLVGKISLFVSNEQHKLENSYKQTDIGIIPYNWDINKIKDHALITTGAKNTQDRNLGGKYPFFVRSQTVEKIDSYSFDGEAVLTAGDGVGTGKVFHYINGKFDFHQRVYKISDFSEKLNGYFFYLYFRSHFLKRIMNLTAKSSVDSVRMEMIADMQIVIPPINEQKAIVSVLSDMDLRVKALERKLSKYQNIKQGMIQELLTGKTRLI